MKRSPGATGKTNACRKHEEQRILEAAPPRLRVAIILLVQTGGRTYTEGLSLRWEQVDLENLVIHLCGDVKTKDTHLMSF